MVYLLGFRECLRDYMKITEGYFGSRGLELKVQRTEKLRWG